MYTLSARIEIYGTGKSEKSCKWVFEKVASVEVVRNSESFCDTCTIVIPRKVKWDNGQEFPLGYGDRVVVRLGYDGDTEEVFRGYITGISLDSPIMLQCQDEMFLLRGVPAEPVSYTNAKLSEVIDGQQVGFPVHKGDDISVGPFRVGTGSVYNLLGLLTPLDVRSFVKVENGEPHLWCGVGFDTGTKFRTVLHDRNIIDSSKLKTSRKEDIKLKVVVRSLLPDTNELLIAEAGDEGGAIRYKDVYGLSEQEIKEIAQAMVDRHKASTDGLSGTLTTFGHCLLDKMDNVAVKLGGDPKGVYQVKKNTIRYGVQGLRQDVTLGERIE